MSSILGTKEIWSLVCKATSIRQPVHVSIRVSLNLCLQQVTAVQKGDQPCRLGYSAGHECTQALCRGSPVKKTPIQENPEGHLLVPHTPCLIHTLCVPHTFELWRLTVAATAETHVRTVVPRWFQAFILCLMVNILGESAVLHWFCAW